MKKLLKIPFLFVILVVFNGTILSDSGSLDPEAVPLFSLALPSGALWHATKGDFIVIGGIIILFLEIYKSIRNNRATFFEHILSFLIFATLMVEFIVWPAACNSTCVILMVICLIDVISGFVISMSSSRKDFNLGGIH